MCNLKVSGKITIEQASGTIQIRQPYLTINGFSAPAPGVTIEKDVPCFEGIKIGATHDIEMFGVRVDGGGWGWEKGNPNNPEVCPGSMNNIAGLALDGDMAPGTNNPPAWDPNPNPNPRGLYRVNVSHNTFQRGMDSNFDPYGHIVDGTFQGNFAHDNWHPSSMTAKVAQTSMPRLRISWYANLYARNGERQPQITHEVQKLDARNNVTYGWWQPGGGGYGMRWKGMSGLPPSEPANVVGNAWLANKALTVQTHEGPKIVWDVSDPDRGCFWGDIPKDGNDGPHTRIKATALYYADNFFPLGRSYGGWNCISTETGQSPFPVPPNAALPPIELEDVIAQAGMPWPTQEEVDLKAEVAAALATRKAR